jgi:translation initiation factor 4G
METWYLDGREDSSSNALANRRDSTVGFILRLFSICPRYSRETLISLHQFGNNPTPEIQTLYGYRATSERGECKPLAGSGSGPKSPNKPRRDGNKRRDEIDEPHPDEKTIFKQKEDVFRYDTHRVVDENTADAVIHKAIALLNKLSPETFEKLSEQFMNIGMETESIMCRVVDLIVSKAQMEEPFCFMYADLCKKITDKWTSPDDGAEEEAEQTTNDGPSGEKDLGKVFRTRLLTRCQEEFQQDREAAIRAIQSLEIPEEDKEEKLFVLRKRYTGHMRFVGEIYMKDLIKANKMFVCVAELLVSRDEEKLSCLCKLLQTIGKKLEAYDVKKKKGKFREFFQTISELSGEKSLSTKIRFAFKDLIEMRNNNWTARREEEKAKKLSEIRSDGNSTPSGHAQGPPTNPGVKASVPRVQAQDVRLLGQPSPVPPEEWSVVSAKGGKKSAPSVAKVPAGRPPSKGAPPSVTVGNKFSALTSSSPSSASSQRSGRRGRRDDDEDETPKFKGKNPPQVSIPSSSTLSAFSPQETESPVGSEMSPILRKSSAVGENGLVGEETLTSAVAIMNEFFLNDLVTEAIDVMKELVHPNGMGDVIRAMIRAVLEKKPAERTKFNILVASFFTAGNGLLTTDQCVAGISSFLNDYDDIVFDVPLVGDYVAGIIGSLYNAGALGNLSFIFHLPDENNFSISMSQHSLLVKVGSPLLQSFIFFFLDLCFCS